MKLGLHVPNFTWDSGPANLGADLARVARTAEEAGFDRMSVMDHLFQMVRLGGPEMEMLESTTTLGFLAGHTSRMKLLALVTAVVYREPGMLAKSVTTLDVLSGGRAMLGIGAAWYEEEALGLGLPFPPLAERFERLEEALQICHQMWSDDDKPFHGAHYELARTLNLPQALSRPHPPILIGGSGERKTLRLVAKYADACNLAQRGDLDHKLEVLREHCENEGRDYDEIEKTVLFNFDPGTNGESANEILDQLGELAEMGITVAHGSVVGVATIRPLELLGELVVGPAAAL
jgi:F420-dependent oxidoreductase-like protein